MSPQKESLSETLRKLLDQSEPGELALGTMFDRVGDKGFGLLLIILALPSALPVPAPGYSTPFGALLAVLALQMILGRRVPWLPARARQRKLSQKLGEKMIGTAARFFGKFEHLIKPRMAWIGGPIGLPLMGSLVLVMACLMILPIPLTNTAPAMVIFLIGIGLTEDDGLFAAFAMVLGLLAVALYGYIIYLTMTLGVEGVWMLKDRLLGR